MSRALELPEHVWSALQQTAKDCGVSPADWIASHLTVPADANGALASVQDEVADDLEPPTYTSVPLERVATVQVVCVAGRERPPLPYPLDELCE